MKTIKKALLLSVAIVFAFCGNVFAQAVTTSATVLDNLAYTSETDLNFGSFANTFTSGTAIIDPANSANDSGVNGVRGTDYTAGKIFISGSASQSVSVSLDNTTVTLTTIGTTDVFALSAIDMSQAVGQGATNEGGTALANGSSLTLDGSGQATVWIGGALTPSDNDGGNMFSGTYTNTTDLTFTIDYSF